MNAISPAVVVGADPFLLHGPAHISLSGGRTSAYMLWRILQAHGGTLPDDVVVAFANTGREMPATLDFVRDCGAAWNVRIRWIEYRHAPGGSPYAEVSHNSASRNGEPFEQLVLARSMLPNPVARFCTSELKIRAMARFLKTEMGWKDWTAAVGLRADEERRVERATNPENQRKHAEGGWVVCPLAEAGVTQADVFRFWKAQPFDLRLAGPWEGNCDGCFLKNNSALARMFLDHPERMTWWADIEQARVDGKFGHPIARRTAQFRFHRNYATMGRIVRDQGRLPFDLDEEIIPCEDAGCGI